MTSNDASGDPLLSPPDSDPPAVGTEKGREGGRGRGRERERERGGDGGKRERE